MRFSDGTPRSVIPETYADVAIIGLAVPEYQTYIKPEARKSFKVFDQVEIGKAVPDEHAGAAIRGLFALARRFSPDTPLPLLDPQTTSEEIELVARCADVAIDRLLQDPA